MMFRSIGYIESGDLVFMLDERTVCTAPTLRAYTAVAVALFGWLP